MKKSTSSNLNCPILFSEDLIDLKTMLLNAKNIIVLAGAGISVSSGIPGIALLLF